ncbi:MAG: preprotein translocase subunit SecY [Candidatus Kerfeldbacteria bacterium]|nr:preprotein translocase subunit SecY [Candidatus Kerfeldbacteria bacterium]
MANAFLQLWKIPDLRRKILFVLASLAIFRLAAHIPVPGVATEGLKNFFNSNQILGLLNVFSGGALENFSIVMLGVGPYITASIIFQLLGYIIPRLEELQKEGEHGQQKINQWTRMLTVPLAILQAFATITLLSQTGGQLGGPAAAQGVIPVLHGWELVTALVTITAGSMLLMWIGELITEKKIGNGISLLIFAGIVARLPVSMQQFFATFDSTKVLGTLLFLAVALLTIVAVVFITEGQRNIPVSYARRIRGNRVYGGVNTHLPMRVNQAGVIPIIFAISLVVLPPLLAQFLQRLNIAWLSSGSQFIVNLFNNQVFYGGFYFLLVVAFTYFYTYVIFHPEQIAENLQKQGGFIPGIRPGEPTTRYLAGISNRILLTGSMFLGVIAVLPVVLQGASGRSFVIGGTSLLIVVSVVIETVKQIESQLVMRDYEGF